MALPDPCELCAPFEGLWKETKAGALKRCDCERGQALTAQDLLRRQPPAADYTPQISITEASAGVSMLSGLKFFPAEEGARLIVANQLRALCHDADEVLWLATRMHELFTEWPGVQSMRAIAWSKFIPLDRKPAMGEAQLFPDGVPAEVETPTGRAALPRGYDRDLDTELRKLMAERKKLN